MNHLVNLYYIHFTAGWWQEWRSCWTWCCFSSSLAVHALYVSSCST